MILETQRLTLREMTQDDYADLCKILQDKEVMYAYEHAFSDEEAQAGWIISSAVIRRTGLAFGRWCSRIPGK